jgi:hypothetical protein
MVEEIPDPVSDGLPTTWVPLIFFKAYIFLIVIIFAQYVIYARCPGI